MIESKAWLSSAAIIGLVFGLNFPDPNLSGGRAPSLPLGFTLLAANETQADDQSKIQSDENADESAKMGKDPGTHSGDHGSTTENDTKKVDQPPRTNPTTSN
jgi:hypothetical protein